MGQWVKIQSAPLWRPWLPVSWLTRRLHHSMRKTLVAELKKSGQPRHFICEITGHSQESSLGDYDKIAENQRKELSHVISGLRLVISGTKRLTHRVRLLWPWIKRLPSNNELPWYIFPKSNNRAKCIRILKSRVWSQTKLHSTHFNYHY